MDLIIAQHLPLITNRIPFTFQPPPPLQPLTNRKEFLDTHEPSALPSKLNPSALPNGASPLKYSASVQFGFQKNRETDMEDKDGEEDDNEEDGEEVFETATLIPKPPGEPGRPHSGGYSLDEALSPWGETLAKVTTFIKEYADKALDTTASYSKQDCEKLDGICKAASARFPILTKYASAWPARDILKLHLKYTSEAHRKNEAQKKKPQRARRHAIARTPAPVRDIDIDVE